MDYLGSDHKIQYMNVVNTGDIIYLRKIASESWNWIKIDKRKIREEVKGLRDPGILATPEAIDRTIDTLIMQF